ncbi:MAG: pyruvate, phosphate dikinase [Deltaproteobacteria bacterium]|jgi:pyruvate,orthophosphate dikinase|nr:pyruvate, phosphate dikinase [Deltaproteobacteria bacterium]
MTKFVYSFGGRKTEGQGNMKDLLGGKGANLAEMCRLSLPVPAGFTITTEVCSVYYRDGDNFPSPSLKKEVHAALAQVEKIMDAKFGSAQNPLLVSCRSGARVSMPGMMDTVLNIGLNDDTVKGLIANTDNPRFAYDSYRRFVAMYGDVVLGLKPESDKDHDPFDKILEDLKKSKGYEYDTELTTEDLQGLVASFKSIIKAKTGQPFPEDPYDQLWGAIKAVFRSWMIPRAITYRQQNHIPEHWGTAVNVQAMVFGNMGEDSATGVAFSRDPSTGENYFYGEFLVNAQGEDVVAGIRTPNPINRAKPLPKDVDATLADIMPDIYRKLNNIRSILEKHYRDMQDIEFTIQKGVLWMLQCRNGKRTAHAAVKIATDLVKEKLITRQEALLRIEPEQLTQILLPIFDEKDPIYKKRSVIAKGLPASPGATVGKVVFSAADAEEQAQAGEKVILVRVETSPEDIKGMYAAKGILTARGGMTSHAAVVARGMGRTCVAGAPINIDYNKGQFTNEEGLVVKAGDCISLDGTLGEVIVGAMPTQQVAQSEDFNTLMDWVDENKQMAVRTNADTPHDSEVARLYRAEGIGLCRTEHMFFESDRIDHIRAMILADNEEGRKKALDALLPMQRQDFYGIFKAMDGLPVTVRTLDPPLHEFLPHTDAEIATLAKKFSIPLNAVKDRINALKEQNPMLGLRGCRLGILYPEITAMQVRAIFEAAIKAASENIKVLPEIMIPLVGNEREFAAQKKIVDQIAEEVLSKSKVDLHYLVGTMIELPRAALVADKIVQAGAEFFSFGTNDLTQTTFGLSRDDSGIFLPSYLKQNIWARDPFVTIDQEGMGQLIEMGVQKGRSAFSRLKIGICGEHGGDPESVVFCYKSNFDYVSCSPHRVPIARLAAAQAAIMAKSQGGGSKKGKAKVGSSSRPSKGKAPKAINPLAIKAVANLKPQAPKNVGASSSKESSSKLKTKGAKALQVKASAKKAIDALKSDKRGRPKKNPA